MVDNTNILVSRLPDSADIDGISYVLKTDFKSSLNTMLAFEDNSLTAEEKSMVLLQNLFEEIPPNLVEAMKVGQWFLNAGNSEEDENDDSPKLYSFSQDASLIFAAFRNTHGIDLQEVSMHWWKFLALFMDLGTTTAFCQMIAFRKRIHSGKATPEEKKAARDMGSAFEIEQIDDRSVEEKERAQEFDRLVEEQKRKRDG